MKRFTPMLMIVCLLTASASLAGAVDDAQLPNPLKDIRVGQWVSYPVSWEEDEGVQKDTLVAIEGDGDARKLTALREIIVNGEVVESEERAFTYAEAVEDLRSLFTEAEDVSIAAVKLDVNGKQMDCAQVTFTDGSTECRLYLSEDVPLTGIVRFEVEGLDRPVMAVMDFEK